MMAKRKWIISRKHYTETKDWATRTPLKTDTTPENHFKLMHKLPFSVFIFVRGHHGCDRMVVGFTTTYVISTYHP